MKFPDITIQVKSEPRGAGFVFKDSVVGVISINKLLVQKTEFTPTDFELFTLLAGHAATAIFSAKLYSTSARKLTTLQGFLDLIKTQPAKP